MPWMLKSQGQRLEAVSSPDLFFLEVVVNPRQIYRRGRQEFDVFAQHLSDIVPAVIPLVGNDLSLGDI